MSKAFDEFRVEVLLAFQRALWDLVTPELRAVAARIEYPIIGARFLYENATDAERLIVAEVETYVCADFAPPVVVEFEAVRLPAEMPRDLQVGEMWIYRRREAY